MKLNLIDLEKYERQEHFIHYLKNVPCSYSMTVNIDITELLKLLKEKHYKLGSDSCTGPYPYRIRRGR